MLDPRFEKRFIRSIPYGKDNAVSMKSLADAYGVEERKIRLIVQLLREHGVPIIGDRHGYYFAGSYEEQRDVVDLLTARARSAEISLATHKKALDQIRQLRPEG